MGGGCSKEGEVPVLRDTDAENIANTSGLSRDEVDLFVAFFGIFLGMYLILVIIEQLILCDPVKYEKQKNFANDHSPYICSCR